MRVDQHFVGRKLCELYLMADNLCRINPVKPDKCRTFPFEWVNPDSETVCPALSVG